MSSRRLTMRWRIGQTQPVQGRTHAERASGDTTGLQRSSVDRALGRRLGTSGRRGATILLSASTFETRNQASRRALDSTPSRIPRPRGTGETRSERTPSVQGVASLGRGGSRRSDGDLARASSAGGRTEGLGQERRHPTEHSQHAAAPELEGARVLAREALGQGRRRRGCAAHAPLPDRRSERDHPSPRDYGYSRISREGALQSRRGRLPRAVRRRQSGVRPARRNGAAVGDELPGRRSTRAQPRIRTRRGASPRWCWPTRCAGPLPLSCRLLGRP